MNRQPREERRQGSGNEVVARRKPYDWVELVLIAVSIVVTVFVVLPLLPLYRWGKRRAAARRSRRLREDWSGTEFFCYSTRGTSRSWIEAHVLPALPGSMVILRYGHGRAIELTRGEFDRDLILDLVAGAGEDRLPKVLRLEAGDVRSFSIHGVVYHSIARREGASRAVRALMDGISVLRHTGIVGDLAEPP